MKRQKLVFLFLSLVLIFSMTLTGCGSQSPAKSSNSGAASGNGAGTVKGGTVKFGVWNSPPGVFNPVLATNDYDYNVTYLVFEGMIAQTPKGELEPGLAKSWTVSDDGKTFTFKLRDNVKWQDGTPFTADDVKYTFEFVGSPDYSGGRASYITPIAGADAYKKGQAQSISGIKVIDPNTISITTTNKYSSGLLNFGAGIQIIPKHIWEKVGPKNAATATDVLRNPIGTGPFKMSKFVPDQYVELSANDNYWGGRPNLGKIILQVANQDTAQAQLLNGDINMMTLSQLDKQDLDLYKSKNINVITSELNAYQYMGLNDSMEIFKDKRVRQALTYAINREAIVKDLLYGAGEVASNPYPPSFWAHPEKGLNDYKYNPQKAIELLKEAGWQYNDKDKLMYLDGKPVKLVLKYPTGNKSREQSAPLIQQNLKDIGIQVELQSMEFGTLSDQVKKGDYQMFLMGQGNGSDGDITKFYISSGFAPQGNNLVRYANPQVDDLMAKGFQYMTIEERKPVYNQLALLLNEEMPVVYLYHWDSAIAVNGIKGVQYSPNAPTYFYDVKDWSLTQK